VPDLSERAAVPVVIRLDGSIEPASVRASCARAVGRIDAQGGDPAIVCDVRSIIHPDLASLDLVARIVLEARRRRRDITVKGATDGLIGLLALAGLDEVVPCGPLGPSLAVEVVGQPEHREEPLGVEEERDPTDPVTRDIDDLERPRG
jgi:hypothetical protein